jgi:phage tail-like protein
MASTRRRVERRNVSIVLMDSDGYTESKRWNLYGAWPTEWNGRQLDGANDEVAVDTLTLTFKRRSASDPSAATARGLQRRPQAPTDREQ